MPPVCLSRECYHEAVDIPTADFRNDCLFVEVLNARDVIPLDNNGLSDPFVIVELLPKRVFQCQEQQTHVQKATLNPTFDECFEL